MTNSQYYQKNFFKRTLSLIVSTVKNFSSGGLKVNAVTGSIIGFVILIFFLEYKVFESVYGITKNLVLSVSVLSITAGAGVYADVIMKKNKHATDDQILISNVIFYISLAMSAFAGFGIWAQSSGRDVVDMGFMKFQLPEFSSSLFIVATVVTVIDVLLFRAYYDGDVASMHERSKARSEAKKKEADLKTQDKLNEFDAEVTARSEQLLVLETHRSGVRTKLIDMYGGNVPPDVMAKAMKELDVILEEIKTGRDINKDGKVGFAQNIKSAFSSRQPQDQLSPSRQFAHEETLEELELSEDGPEVPTDG